MPMKKAKKSENWTKFWAILLAAVLTFAVVAMGKTAAEDAIEKAKEQNQTENVDSNNTTNNNSTNTPSGDTNTPSGDTNTPSGDTNTPSGDTNTPSGDTNNGPSKAEVIKVFNNNLDNLKKLLFTMIENIPTENNNCECANTRANSHV